MIGTLAACHGKPGGVHTSQVIDITQPPTTSRTSQPAFLIQNATITITPDAEYSVSGVIGYSSPTFFGGFSLAYGPGAESVAPDVKVAELAAHGQGVVIITNLSDDPNIATAIRGLEKGQRVRASGWRASMAKAGKQLGPVIKGDNGVDTVFVYPTELQIDDRLYTPAALPAGPKY